MRTKQTFVYGLIAVMITLAFTALFLTGCSDGTDPTDMPGIEYELISGGANNGTYRVTGYTGSDGNVIIPATHDGKDVTEIGNNAFKDSAITSIKIPTSVTSIGSGAFFDCTSITSVTFVAGSQLKIISDSMFYGCASLESIEIPASVTSIDNSAFNICTSLESVTFGAGSQLETIGNVVFHGPNELNNITIPDTVTSIGIAAFAYCSNITSIEIPASVTSIGDDLFAYCTSLETVTFAAGIQLDTIDFSTFMDCTSLTTIKIPTSVTSIGAWAFARCTSLTSIIIPASVTSAGGSPFGSGSPFENWTASQTIYVDGYASESAADAAWTDWRKWCDAVRKYKQSDGTYQ